jgi:hypothetical protein
MTIKFIARNIVLAASSSFLVSCGNGGSVTDLPMLSAQFTPDQLAPPANSVSLRENDVLADTVTLEVWGEDIAQPAVRTTFTIRFDPAVLQFVDFEPGDFFEQQALPSNVAYTVPTPTPAEDDLTVQIVKSNTPLSSQGDGIFVKLRFRVIAVGASALVFEAPSLSSATGGIAQGVQWFGGRVDGL